MILEHLTVLAIARIAERESADLIREAIPLAAQLSRAAEGSQEHYALQQEIARRHGAAQALHKFAQALFDYVPDTQPKDKPS